MIVISLSMRCLLNPMIPTRALRLLSRDYSTTCSTGKQPALIHHASYSSHSPASDKPVGTKKLTKAFGYVSVHLTHYYGVHVYTILLL